MKARGFAALLLEIEAAAERGRNGLPVGISLPAALAAAGAKASILFQGASQDEIRKAAREALVIVAALALVALRDLDNAVAAEHVELATIRARAAARSTGHDHTA